MGYGKARPSLTTKKTLKMHSTSVSAAELREFLEGLSDGQEIQVRVSGGQMDTTTMTFEANL